MFFSFCDCPFPILFLIPFSFPFSRSFHFSLPYEFHVTSVCRKKLLGVSYWQRREWGLDQFLVPWAILLFLPKICYVRMPSISKTACCADRSILALPSACQEHLVTFKLMASQVLRQRTRPLSARISVLRSQRVRAIDISKETITQKMKISES